MFAVRLLIGEFCGAWTFVIWFNNNWIRWWRLLYDGCCIVNTRNCPLCYINLFIWQTNRITMIFKYYRNPVTITFSQCILIDAVGKITFKVTIAGNNWNIQYFKNYNYLSAKLMRDVIIFAQFSLFFRSPSLSSTAPYSVNTKYPTKSGIFANDTIFSQEIYQFSRSVHVYLDVFDRIVSSDS